MVSLQLLFMAHICSYEAGMTLCTKMKTKRVRRNGYFRCKRRDWCKKTGFYSGTFFEHFKLSLKDVFRLSAYWAEHRRFTYEDIAVEMLRETGNKLGFQTLIDNINYFRNDCTEHFLRHPLKIESSGKVI